MRVRGYRNGVGAGRIVPLRPRVVFPHLEPPFQLTELFCNSEGRGSLPSGVMFHLHNLRSALTVRDVCLALHSVHCNYTTRVSYL